MRPLSLELYGFTCYRDPQPPLDFAGMSLFAIAGPTGAGKSTILDGILYALFGMVPRIGKQGVGEFISHGRDVLSVCLDFNVRGRTYRITRRVKRSKKDQLQTIAVLAELQAGEEKSIADTVKTVDASVTQMLGLDFDAFTQTVILPQNQFARFLQSKPKDQRQILQRLLRHTVYDRMRAEAERRRGLLDRDMRSKDEQLAQLTGATPEAFDALSAELVNAVEKRTAAQKERAGASTILQDARARRELTVALEKVRTTAAELERRVEDMARLRVELAEARQAAAVTPKFDMLRLVTERSENIGQDVATARQRVRALEASVTKSNTALEAAESSARDLDSLRDKLHRLHEIRNDVERRPALTGELEKARKQTAAAERSLANALAAVKAATTNAKDATKRLDHSRADAHAVLYDATLHARLDDLRGDAARARTLAEEIDDLGEKRERAARDVEIAQKKTLTAKKAHETAAKDCKQARTARLDAERARLEGSHRLSAAALRQHLVRGEPCPVCDHVVTSVPARSAPPKVAKLDAAVARATEAEHVASQTLQRAGRDLERAEAKVGELSRAMDQLRTDVERRQQKQRAFKKRLTAALADVGPVTDADLLSVFERALDEQRRLSAAREKRQAAVTAAEKLAHELAMALVTAQGAARQAEQGKAQLDEDVHRSASEIEAISARIAAVTSAKDPAAERSTLAATVEILEKNLADARQNARLVGEQLVAAQTKLQVSQEATAAVELELKAARGALEEALAAHGFASGEVAMKAVRPADRIDVLDRQVREFDQAQASARDRLAELEPKIVGREVDGAALTTAERGDAAAQQRLEMAVAAVSRLEEQVETLKKDVGRAQRLSAERTAVLRTLGTTAEMAGDLRSDCFQEYLLEEAFKGLVAGASTRLHEMSRRYTIEWRDSEFYVLDHDNAGERRRAETLSGGETFMASLCLALQLSDEVLHASGAIRMDSLFIDEGFGSLDAQSLSEVTDALENLRQDGDRAVGIISHLPDLTARLPGCIRVDKGMGESKWIVERVG